MRTVRLIHEVMSSPWIISPDQAQHYIPQLHRLLTGDVVGYHDDEDRPSSNQKRYKNEPVLIVAGQMVEADYWSGFSSAKKDSIAVIPVSGPIMKNDSCGDAGTMRMSEWVSSAAANPNIKGIILSVDSPGGTVSGTQTFADAIQKAKLQKPVVSFVQDGMMASAAYWLGSSAHEVIASHATSQIGSIGVYTTIADIKGFYESRGYKVQDVYSSLSTEKNADFRHWQSTGEVPASLVASLDHIAETFISAVKSNRGDKINVKKGDPFKGKIFNAKQAVENGLIDSIGDMDSAVARIEELAKSSPASTSTMKINWKPTWAAIGAVLGIVATTENRELGEADWEAVNADITSKNDQLTAQKAQIDQLTADLATRTTERDNLQATVNAYGTKPGATHTNPEKTKDNIASKEADETIAVLKHNQEAQDIPFIN